MNKNKINIDFYNCLVKLDESYTNNKKGLDFALANILFSTGCNEPKDPYCLFKTVDKFFEDKNYAIEDRKKYFNLICNGCLLSGTKVPSDIHIDIISKYFFVDFDNKDLFNYIVEKYEEYEKLDLEEKIFDEKIKDLFFSAFLSCNVDLVDLKEPVENIKEYLKNKNIDQSKIDELIILSCCAGYALSKKGIEQQKQLVGRYESTIKIEDFRDSLKNISKKDESYMTNDLDDLLL